MTWIDRHLPRSLADQRRERRTAVTLQLAEDFLREMQEGLREFQETANEDRKGFPIASALQRRRPPHD